ncbi:hypothetical protein SY83_18055 [Paenibacillus swuensis]|uniref:DUF402 domain-containing protein n=1 Tax=Paenibacillus swuensis TaxID=1178515 RepID=A0A172TLG8_9BACL|nr:DUF402 domain-containing protein [Paenibacillus swuensis]ANE47881.1 hypothetical protein SY83_18055 [Paenibacillus swuensis]
MKRKFSDRANWRRIVNKSYASVHLNDAEFKGYVTFYKIHQLREPLWKEYLQSRLCLADEGYIWLQHFPENERYVVTTMFNSSLQVVQWYIDICKDQGLTDQGVPWFDDLFLDVIILPSGEVLLVDEDELEEAYDHGEITKSDFDTAKVEANKLLDSIKNGSFVYRELAVDHLQRLFGDLVSKKV